MTMTRRIATGALGLAAVALAATAMRAQSPAPPTMMRSGVFPWDSVAPQPTKVGAVRHFFDNPTPTLSELELHVTTLKPGESPHPPHRHPEEELIIIREGNVESFIEGKADLAVAVLEMDNVVDRMRDEAFISLVHKMNQNPAVTRQALDALLIARNLERVADHATNIAEDVIFWVRGADVRHHFGIEQAGTG